MRRPSQIPFAALATAGALALLLLASSALPAAESLGRNCFFASDISGWQVVAHDRVRVTATKGRQYELVLMSPQPHLATNESLALRTLPGDDRVCAPRDVQLLAGTGGFAVPVREIRLIPPQEKTAAPH